MIDEQTRRPPDSKEKKMGTSAAASVNIVLRVATPVPGKPQGRRVLLCINIEHATCSMNRLLEKMFGGFRSQRFSGKCKHAVKCIKMRIEPRQRKKQAVVRVLKKDVADLIAGGYEADAYRRIDALLVDINLVFCYDLIERFSEHLMDQLPTLRKQSECPKEMMEEISTLIYAAARFPDLRELCVLRHLFVEKYGSSMESCVCSEFAEKLNTRTFSKEKKLQLMESIAQEYCVSWDAKKFDEEACNAPAPKSARCKQVASHARNKDGPLLEDGVDEEIHGSNLSSAGQRHQVETELKNIHVISATNGRPLERQHEINSAILSYDKHDGAPSVALKYDLPQNKRHGGRQYEEEETMDTLLKHSGRKGTSAKEPGRERPRQVSPLEKEVSLPSAPVTGVRAHPRLPDYDQLLANLTLK